MNKEEIKVISQEFAKIHGEKLHKPTRENAITFFEFGGKAQTDTEPRFTLQIDGIFRLTKGDEIILAKDDMFQPIATLENAPDFHWDKFNWNVQGNNRFDEEVSKYFDEESNEFIVKKMAISKWGDLKICFESGYVLEVFIDISGDEECWRFFEGESEEYLVVSGQGLYSAMNTIG